MIFVAISFMLFHSAMYTVICDFSMLQMRVSFDFISSKVDMMVFVYVIFDFFAAKRTEDGKSVGVRGLEGYTMFAIMYNYKILVPKILLLLS